ncbi:MAG: redoxin domain-containing protein [Alphaproteobacteria bacterium]
MHQAVVWNENIEKIRAQGIEVVSVTADDVATVQRFAKLRKIDYPLLSDANRDVINAFGLFNDRFPEGSRYRGTAIPMVIVANAEGVVTHVYNGHGYTEDHEIATIVNNAIEATEAPKSQ